MTAQTMTCDAVDARLEDYLEGTLDAAGREAVERHAAACARCGELVADLNGITAAAAALPTLRPSRDLWDGIAARIDAPVIEIGTRHSALGARRRPLWLGAAAAVLVVVSAGVSHLLTRRAMQEPEATSQVAAATPATPAPAAPETTVTRQAAAERRTARRADASRSRSSTSPVPPPPSLQLTARSAADVVYDREIASLRRMVRERSAELDPATVRVLEQSLGVIDGAIAQSRAALARDPGSAFLNQQLTSALDKKLELLRTAAALPAGRT